MITHPIIAGATMLLPFSLRSFLADIPKTLLRKASHIDRSPASYTDAGFTLIEMLVVLVIVGLLAALAGPKVMGQLMGAKADSTKVQIEMLQMALDLYRLDTGSYPTTQQGLQALLTDPNRTPGWNGPYLDKRELPADGWGSPYVYRSPGERAPYEIISLGRDKVPGGDGDDTDIVSSGT